MTKHEVQLTAADLDHALDRAATFKEVTVVQAEYKSGLDVLLLNLSDGRRQIIPREEMEGLRGVPRSQVAQIEIVGGGTGLHWPALNVSHYVPTLLCHIYGTKRWIERIGQGKLKASA